MPIGKFADFDACVRAMTGKVDDPKAYCGSLEKRMGKKAKEAEISLDQQMSAVCQAVRATYNGDAPGDYTYVEVVFPDHVIAKKGGKLWWIDYTISDDGKVTLSSDPKPVVYAKAAEGQVFGPLNDDGTPFVPGPVKEGEATPAKPSGKKWSVLIIQEGMSKNRNRYQRKALKAAAPKYEGVKVYMDHQEEARRYGRSTRDLAGFLKTVQPVLLNEAPEQTESDGQGILALAGTLVVTKESVRQEMVDAYEEGNPNLFGLSHDAMCESTTAMDADGPFYDISNIESVKSVDLVTNAAAGGRVLRLVASDVVAHTLEKDGIMLQKMIEAIKASGNAALIAKLESLGKEPNEDQVLGIYQDALKPTAEPKPAKETAPPAPTPAPVQDPAQPKQVQVNEAEFMEVRRDGLTSFLEATLAGCSLPEPAKDKLRRRFTAEIASATLPAKAVITSAVKEDVDLFAQLAEKKILIPISTLGRAEVIKSNLDQAKEALDKFFDPKTPLQSFRNLYVDITGDRNVTGQKQECVRLKEALDSTSFDQILGDSITRRMLAEYAAADMANWRGTIAQVVPVNDFRTQRRMRFGGYGNLPTVGQGAPYAALTSPTDEEAIYAPAKRGGTESLTIEMIANDDVGAVRRIPQRLARAANQTLYEFVWDFLRTNGLIYDGVALAAAGHGNNIITTALSMANISTARLRMKAQTDMSNAKRLGLSIRYLIVPNDLEELAFQLTTSDRVTGSNNNDPNFIKKLNLNVIVVDYWTDANDYWFAASTDQTPLIEVGFLGGREEPELFVQDVPTQGSLFSHDQITYKIRHVYGGAVLDFRGFVGGIVP